MFYRDLALVFLLGVLALSTQASASAVTQVGTVVLLVVRSLSYATTLQSASQQVKELSPNADELLDRLSELEGDRATFGREPLDSIDAVELFGAGYCYADGDLTLQPTDLVVARGEAVGIVGSSGGGKSTFLHVLLRLRIPSTGEVRIGGSNYEDFNLGDWTRRVAFVPQEPQLLEQSVRENVRFHRAWISDEAVERVIEQAHLSPFVEAHADGVGAMLGPRGSGLSGGQKQRLAIARALAGHPDLLVLDEPTSALDGDSEKEIQRTLEALKGSVTMVIVAHRLSTLAFCDRVLSVEDGVVTEISPSDIGGH
jgi:ATP-binding cassette subfamily B protein